MRLPLYSLFYYLLSAMILVSESFIHRITKMRVFNVKYIHLCSNQIDFPVERRPNKTYNSYNIDVYEQHPNTAEVALRHCLFFGKFAERHVVSAHTVEAFNIAVNFVNKFYKDDSAGKHVIIDSGCGTGMSSVALALRWPDRVVIGVDKSICRLQKNGLYGEESEDAVQDASIKQCKNLLLLRAELTDFWFLASASDWIIDAHFLLYPNPWPKSKQLSRRWHGHPVFPLLIGLGGRLIVRSNWRTYLDEFETAFRVANLPGNLPGLEDEKVALTVDEYRPKFGISRFERKYMATDTPLFQLKAELPVRYPDERTALLEEWRKPRANV